MGRSLRSAAMVTKPSLGMGISIYTGRVTLVKNLIWVAIGTLDRHQKTHSGRKLFNAVIVKRLSLKKKTWNTYEDSHTGEKPFDCSNCDTELF